MIFTILTERRSLRKNIKLIPVGMFNQAEKRGATRDKRVSSLCLPWQLNAQRLMFASRVFIYCSHSVEAPGAVRLGTIRSLLQSFCVSLRLLFMHVSRSAGDIYLDANGSLPANPDMLVQSVYCVTFSDPCFNFCFFKKMFCSSYQS